MFDLERAIADWRQKLKHAGVKASVVLEELESHLRDEIETQLRLGLTERQAFETAVAQIGPSKILGREFTGEQRLLRAVLFAGMCLYVLAAGVPVLLKLGSFSDISSAQQMSALAAVAVTVMVLFGGRLLWRMLPVVSKLPLRIVIYCSAVMLLFVWLALVYDYVMTRVEWDMSQLVVAILWTLSPWGAVCSIAWGMEEAVANQTAKAHV